jgi:hypothetical protein
VTTSRISRSRSRITPPRIVFCGSMSALAVMVAVAEELAEAKVAAVVPPADDEALTLSANAMLVRKRRASLAHIRRILDRSTIAILVVNIDKYGQRDYIGPNAFGEIAIAFAHGRRVFLYQGMPEQYEEELTAWGATCLHGDLREVIACVTEATGAAAPDGQLALFA